jgi:hypothetical protein
MGPKSVHSQSTACARPKINRRPWSKLSPFRLIATVCIVRSWRPVRSQIHALPHTPRAVPRTFPRPFSPGRRASSIDQARPVGVGDGAAGRQNADAVAAVYRTRPVSRAALGQPRAPAYARATRNEPGEDERVRRRRAPEVRRGRAGICQWMEGSG